VCPADQNEDEAKYQPFRDFSDGVEIIVILGKRRRMMDEKQMKKFLAGLCLTGLLTGAGLTPANAQQSGQSG
jgi:radical SAM modification target selenobiotic family peptide